MIVRNGHNVAERYKGSSRIEEVYRGSRLVFGGSAPLGDVPPNDEIWYTTVEGLAFHPGPFYGSGDFRSHIVSNTYRGGRGVIKFDGDITVIPGYAFAFSDVYGDNCLLSEVWIPAGVSRIDSNAFRDCTGLEAVHIFGDTSVNNMAFDGCTALMDVYCYSTETFLSYAGSMAFPSLPDGGTFHYYEGVDASSWWENYFMSHGWSEAYIPSDIVGVELTELATPTVEADATSCDVGYVYTVTYANGIAIRREYVHTVVFTANDGDNARIITDDFIDEMGNPLTCVVTQLSNAGDTFPEDDATHKYLNPMGTLFSQWTEPCRALTEATKDDWSGLVSWCAKMKYGHAKDYLEQLYNAGYILGTPVIGNDRTYGENIYGATNRTLVGLLMISSYGTYNSNGRADYVEADGNGCCKYSYSTGYGREAGDMYIPIYSN